jgi:F0F1-type ATP synthase assembly protein I
VKKDPGNRDDNAWLVAGRYLALMTTVPAAIFVGYEIGTWLDSQFSTHSLKLVCVVLGTVAGFVPIFRELSRNE